MTLSNPKPSADSLLTRGMAMSCRAWNYDLNRKIGTIHKRGYKKEWGYRGGCDTITLQAVPRKFGYGLLLSGDNGVTGEYRFRCKDDSFVCGESVSVNLIELSSALCGYDGATGHVSLAVLACGSLSVLHDSGFHAVLAAA